VVGHVHHPYDSLVLFEAKDILSDWSPPTRHPKLRESALYRRALPAPLIQPSSRTVNHSRSYPTPFPLAH
jgi:hypothetical protein